MFFSHPQHGLYDLFVRAVRKPVRTADGLFVERYKAEICSRWGDGVVITEYTTSYSFLFPHHALAWAWDVVLEHGWEVEYGPFEKDQIIGSREHTYVPNLQHTLDIIRARNHADNADDIRSNPDAN